MFRDIALSFAPKHFHVFRTYSNSSSLKQISVYIYQDLSLSHHPKERSRHWIQITILLSAHSPYGSVAPDAKWDCSKPKG